MKRSEQQLARTLDVDDTGISIPGYLPYLDSGPVRLLWATENPVPVKLLAGGKFDEELFNDVLTVRTNTDSRWEVQEALMDDYSDQYCLYVEDLPVGALGVTRALHGEVFMQEFYPSALFDRYFDRIVSAYRFRLLPRYRKTSALSAGASLAFTMIREAWREHIAKGAGIDVINVELKYMPYYRRLGYVHCEGYDFMCPIFHEPVSIMFLPTDPSRKSVIQDLVQNRDDCVFLDDVFACLNRVQVYPKQRAIL